MDEGTRVELVRTSDLFTQLKPGDRGTVTKTDAAGTIHVNWDTGSTLGMIPGMDVIQEVTD